VDTLRQVLVIEEDDEIAQLVKLELSGLACNVKLASDGAAGLAEATSRHYDLIILELILPGIDGLEICRRVRACERYTPILMLSARSTEIDRVLALEIGADDYVTKPFSVPELVARVKAIFRLVDRVVNRVADAAVNAVADAVADAAVNGASSQAAAQPNPVESRELTIDVDKRDVVVGTRHVDLTVKEFELLLHFARNPGRVYSRTQLLDQVWGYSHNGYEHTVNSHINRLRAKIENNPQQPKYIQTVWGVGYRFRTRR
jgi:DNA-binding response OmpR family regulator